MNHLNKYADFRDGKTKLHASQDSLNTPRMLQYYDETLLVRGSDGEENTIGNRFFPVESMPSRNETRNKISDRSGPNEKM